MTEPEWVEDEQLESLLEKRIAREFGWQWTVRQLPLRPGCWAVVLHRLSKVTADQTAWKIRTGRIEGVPQDTVSTVVRRSPGSPSTWTVYAKTIESPFSPDWVSNDELLEDLERDKKV